MKIHFVAAIAQTALYGKYYERIIHTLEKAGHTIISDHIVDQDMKKIFSESDDDKISHYKKVLKWITQSEIVVAEASFPSTVHVGHEISLALEKGKPVVVLYKKGNAPVFLQGIDSEKLIIQEYTDVDLEEVLTNTLDFASDQQETRFNFFVSPKISSYLDWVAKNKRLPRAVYLRKLIEDDMARRKENE